MRRRSSTPSNGLHADLEAKLWAMADKLRGNMDSAEYKHVVLGLIFLKYISDAFQAKHAALQAEPYADPEDRDEYTSENIFWVPAEARWPGLQAAAKQPDIGIRIDRAMAAIEADNPAIKGVLPLRGIHLREDRLVDHLLERRVIHVELEELRVLVHEIDGRPNHRGMGIPRFGRPRARFEDRRQTSGAKTEIELEQVYCGKTSKPGVSSERPMTSGVLAWKREYSLPFDS